jgi:hypothetical protein
MLANGIGRWMVIVKVPYFDNLESRHHNPRNGHKFFKTHLMNGIRLTLKDGWALTFFIDVLAIYIGK